MERISMQETRNLEGEIIMPAQITVTSEIGVGFGGITAPEFTQAEAEAEASEADQFRVNIDWRNPAVCLDGRTLAEVAQALGLGAHLAGGAESLLVAAKAAGLQLQGAELLAKAKERGFTLGAHVDSTNRAEGFANGTGCGANDKITTISDLFTQHKGGLEPTVQSLMGSDFNAGTYQDVTIAPVNDDKNFLKDTVGEDLTETLLDDHEGVHGHREQMVIFNYVENTTIDRDAYFKATGKQVFVVDVWYIKKLANAMAEGVDAEAQASMLFHTMMAYQVATYIALCDGKHRAAVLTPEQVAVAA